MKVFLSKLIWLKLSDFFCGCHHPPCQSEQDFLQTNNINWQSKISNFIVDTMSVMIPWYNRHPVTTSLIGNTTGPILTKKENTFQGWETFKKKRVTTSIYTSIFICFYTYLFKIIMYGVFVCMHTISRFVLVVIYESMVPARPRTSTAIAQGADQGDWSSPKI